MNREKESARMTPLAPFKHKFALLLLVCTGVLGGALLLGHARHTSPAQNPEAVSGEQHGDLPPVW
jgi:hypothetical protein